MCLRQSICGWSSVIDDGAAIAETAVHEAPGFQDRAVAATKAAVKTVLNVGCGYALRRGLHPTFLGPEWREVRLDINPAVQPDLLCSITDMGPVGDGTVDAVWSSHNLEHLHRHEVPIALAEFMRVLRPGGRLLLTLPDLQSVAELVVKDQLETEAYLSRSGPITPLDMIFGHGASLARGDRYMAHKCGFTMTTLQTLLEEARFAGVRVWRGKSFDIWATGNKLGV
jgi:predicted SAM-dependent methyltransferase